MQQSRNFPLASLQRLILHAIGKAFWQIMKGNKVEKYYCKAIIYTQSFWQELKGPSPTHDCKAIKSSFQMVFLYFFENFHEGIEFMELCWLRASIKKGILVEQAKLVFCMHGHSTASHISKHWSYSLSLVSRIVGCIATLIVIDDNAIINHPIQDECMLVVAPTTKRFS